MNPPNNRRFWEVMVGIFLLILVLAGVGNGDAILPFILGGLGIYLLARQFNQSKSSMDPTSAYAAEFIEEDAPPLRQSGADQVHRHAIDAIVRAKRDPNETQVLPVDIGVMAFRAGEDPVVYRTQPVLDDIDYLQPFVQLRLPTRATGRIKFELVDADGQVLFIHEDYHQLERGRNLVTPAARLPIHDAQAMNGAWELRISADGVPLAIHRFEWGEREEKVIRRQMQTDGEVGNDLRAAMLDSQPGELSLDELLAYQEDEEAQQARRG